MTTFHIIAILRRRYDATPQEKAARKEARANGLCPRCKERPIRNPKNSVCSYCIHKSKVERNRRIIQKAKDKPCMDCDFKYPYYVMEFDHVRGKKLMNVAMMAGQSGSIARVLAEIAKCDIVCSNCHKVREHERRQVLL